MQHLSRRSKIRAVLFAAALCMGILLSVPQKAMAARTVDFSYVEKDIQNWKAVYSPIIESKYSWKSKDLPARQSKTLDTADAIGEIYELETDEYRNTHVSAYRTKKALVLYDVLNGNYSRNAVAAFLDHGYFRDYCEDLLKAGLLPENYRLPVKSYSIEVLDETVNTEDEYGVTEVHSMIRTDSDYLDTEQLLTVALSAGDKKSASEMREKIRGFEDNYTPKSRLTASGTKSGILIGKGN